MPIVRNIRVYTAERDSLTVSWEIEPTVEDLSEWTVAILRSEGQLGPYTQISQTMFAESVFEFQDRGVNLLSKWREFYYRIQLTHPTSGNTLLFGSTPHKLVLEGSDPGGVVMEAQPDLEALEAIRRFGLVLQEYAGRRVLVLRERTFGQRCAHCWDPLKRRSIKSACLTCFGTGFSGGYWSPVDTRCLKPPHQVITALTPLFELQPNDLLMWFNAFPRLKPRDIVVDTEGRRYRTIKVNRSEKSWALTRQTVQMRELSKDQIVYRFQVDLEDWGVDNVTASPHRQFVRATDIDSYHKAAGDLSLSDQVPNQIVGFPTEQEDA